MWACDTKQWVTRRSWRGDRDLGADYFDADRLDVEVPPALLSIADEVVE
jgi:hypothetical protein